VVEFHRSSASDGAAVVRVVGEVDLSTIDELKTAVRSCLADSTAIVLDLSELDFIDSSGLGAFVQLAKEAAAQGASFALTNVGSRTYRLLEITGLAAVFDVRKSGQDADDVSST
jgi:anti-sigma B factor antagonist